MGNYYFADKIKKIMKKCGLNQMQLSKILGVAQGQISNWVNDKSLPNYISMKMLQEKLNLSADEIL
jgi:transcriptional regulator with XRE-family HTH domain